MLSNDEMVSRLARYLLQLKEGDRLQPVREIARLHRVSVGTVSNALSTIEGAGAVKIDRRGHVGSFIEKRSIGQLWAIAEQEPMVISFPLIAHPRLEGLATGLKKQLSEIDIDTYLIFIRGSRTRLKALREKRCHIAVMSEFAAEKLCESGEKIILTLPPQSFVMQHEVFFRTQKSRKKHPLRVAIDRDSFDLEGLTEMEYDGQAVDFKPVTFMQLPRLLKDDYVDAGVWSIDDMEPHLNDQILHRPLSDRVTQIVKQANTSAALVIQSQRESVRVVVESALQVDSLLEIQRLVMSGEMVPEY